MFVLTISQKKKGTYATSGESYEFTEAVTFKSKHFRDLVDLVVTAEGVSHDESVTYEIKKEGEEE